jgi:predicted transcriptional regulator
VYNPNSIYPQVMKKHLAILTRDSIRAVISGDKTVEVRFSKKKIAPFGFVSTGDIVYMKPPGEDLTGQFQVSKVISLEGIDESDLEWIRQEFGPKLSLGSINEEKNYFKEHSGSKYATIMFIGKVDQFITSPIKIIKKDLRGWLVIDDEKHLG